MEIRFQTKEESNRQQEKSFNKLSDSEKELRILQLKEMWKFFPTKKDLLK